MISFLSQVGELAVSANIKFRVCFASRHYPHISIDRGFELILEGEQGHAEDIAAYLRTELRIGQNKTAKEVRQEVQRKSSGIFMWVVLVVGILHKAYDSGHIYALRSTLRDIPGGLHDLFRDFLTRDSHNKGALVLCIQWVLFARYPLSPEELYFAILSGIEPELSLEWHQEETSHDTLRRFILDSSKGLAQITVSENPKVQFIHESVRDFLLKGDDLDQIWSDMGSKFQEQSHDRLTRCCVHQMGLSMLPQPQSIMESQILTSHLETDFGILSLGRYPFLEYAVLNMECHAAMADAHDGSKYRILEKGASSRLRQTCFDTVPDLEGIQWRGNKLTVL
jgi:hypothetical protein